MKYSLMYDTIPTCVNIISLFGNIAEASLTYTNSDSNVLGLLRTQILYFLMEYRMIAVFTFVMEGNLTITVVQEVHA